MHRKRPAALVLAPMAASAVVATSLAFAPFASSQTVAPSITPARVTVDSLVPPGREVELPALVVRNSGVEPLVTRMDTVPDSTSAAHRVEYTPEEFRLDPGADQVVHARLIVPTDSPLGPALVRLRASVAQEVEGSGLGIGLTAAVASTLEFEVGWPPDEAISASESSPALGIPWWLIPLAVASGAVSWTAANLLQRYEIVVRRKPPPEE